MGGREQDLQVREKIMREREKAMEEYERNTKQAEAPHGAMSGWSGGSR